MAKKQHLSKVETNIALNQELEKLRMETSTTSSDLPTTATVNEFAERLTVAPERISRVVEATNEVENKKAPKEGIERGRSAKGELNRTGITALIDRDLLKEVKMFAIQNGVSMSDIINDALTKYLIS